MVNWSMKLIKQKKLAVILKDRNKYAGISTSSELGIASIDLKGCFEDVGVWKVNNLFQIQGEQKYGEQLGEIYVQAKFNLETDSDVDKKRHCATLEDLVSSYGWACGEVLVDILSGCGFAKANHMWCVCYLSSEKEIFLQSNKSEKSATP